MRYLVQVITMFVDVICIVAISYLIYDQAYIYATICTAIFFNKGGLTAWYPGTARERLREMKEVGL